MKVQDLMTKDVRCCSASDTLDAPAGIMWDADCGCVPVLDAHSRIAGMITDRDISMAAMIQGKRLREIPVSTAMARTVFSVKPHDELHVAEDVMRKNAIRRVPVIEGDGRVVGILSMNDLAREAIHQRTGKSSSLTTAELTETIAAVCEPRARHVAIAVV